ncbi:MAG: CvpA family protein [Clostridiales bacterium]|nr:CvpA family protein [Clostridiales bacterium]
MNILEIIVIVITIALIFSGWCRGFVKKLTSMLMLALSIVLVSAVLPYVTSFLKDNTPLYDYIYEQCEQTLSDEFDSLQTSLGSISFTTGDASAAAASDLSRDEIKSLMEQYGYGDYTSLIDSLTDEELQQYVEQYLDGDISSLFTTDSISLLSGSGDSGASGDDAQEAQAAVSTVQSEIINALPVPQMIKNMLINNNNEETYASLDVSGFQEYLVESLSTLILNAISFLVTILLVNLALRLAFLLLDVFAHLPVVGFANRLAGAALGLVEALFLLWIFFLILTVAETTDVGLSLMTMVNDSALLSWAYEANLFLRIVVWTAARFM